MTTTFEVIYLGFSGTEIDTTESDNISNAANLLVGMSYGSLSSPLFANIQNLSPNSGGTIYDTDNNTATDQFTAGGTVYTMDGAAIYLATITYADGTTDQVEVTVAQASSGDQFLFPPTFGNEAQQAILEAGPIQSLTLDSLVSNAVEPVKDRIDIDFDGPVDGTGLSDGMTVGYTDGQGDRIGAGDDLIFGNGGSDIIEGGGGNDIIEGGAGNDVIYGDMADGSTFGTLSPANSDNLSDSGGTETFNIRAVELVTLANGDLIMITSERGSSNAGIASYRIDNDPDSATYGQILGGQIDIESASVNGIGFQDIEDMAAVTLSNGATYLYTADPQGNSIGITRINPDGTLTNQPTLTDGSANQLFDDVQELSIATVGNTHFLLSLGGGSDGGIDDALIVHRINADGSLTQTDLEVDGSGANENFLNNNNPTEASLLESFTDSNGNTFVIAGGANDGISLWTLNGAGQLSFQNARGDGQAGAGDTDPQGNDLGRDLIAPTITGLADVDAGAFAQINGQVYLFVGGMDDDINIFRIDPDTVNNDGTFDLTLVGQVDNLVTDISAMTFLPTDNGGSLVVGAETSGLRFYDVTVNPGGTVSLTLSNTISDGSGPEFADSEAIDVEGGILVSAGDDDDGVGIVTTGLNPEAQFAGDDSILGGDGSDTIFGGGGNDTINGGEGGDTIVAGAGDDLIIINDSMVLQGQVIAGDGIDTLILDPSNDRNLTVDLDFGNAFDGLGWSELITGVENLTTADGNDTVSDNASDNLIITNGGNDVLRAGLGSDTLLGGDGNDLLIRGGTDVNDVLNVLNGGAGNDTIRLQDGINVNDQVDGGDGIDTLEVLPGDNRNLTVNMGAGNVVDGTIGTQEFVNIENITTGGGNDTIYGGVGDNVLDGGAGNDLIVGGNGADWIIGGTGNDVLVGGNNGNTLPASGDQSATGNDTLDGGAGNDTLFGNTGSDTLRGGADNDLLFGEFGTDSLDGGTGADTLDGGAQNDTLSGGAGNDRLTGGAGNDLFQYTPGDGLDTISDFNAGITGTLNDGISTNNDFIDLSGYYDHLSELWADQQDDGILNQSNAVNTKGNLVDYSDNIQFDTDGISGNEGIVFSGATGDNTFFTHENTGVICFGDGTLIDTPRGPIAVEKLSEGDLVRTVDRGYRPLIWVSRTRLVWAVTDDGDKPILIKANALGGGMPKTDLRVSPQHRILLPDSDHDDGVFAPAKSLVGMPGIRQMKGCRSVTYHHLLLDGHEVIFANGLPCESFFPGRRALGLLSGASRSSILRCLMQLSGRPAKMPFHLARHVLKSRAVSKRISQGATIWTQDRLRLSGCLDPTLDALG